MPSSARRLAGGDVRPAARLRRRSRSSTPASRPSRTSAPERASSRQDDDGQQRHEELRRRRLRPRHVRRRYRRRQRRRATPARRRAPDRLASTSSTTRAWALTSDVIAACHWILEHKAQYNIKVANFSLHVSAPASSSWIRSTRQSRSCGSTASRSSLPSGNYGIDGQPSGVLYAPGNDPFVITVGAADITARSTPRATTPRRRGRPGATRTTASPSPSSRRRAGTWSARSPTRRRSRRLGPDSMVAPGYDAALRHVVRGADRLRRGRLPARPPPALDARPGQGSAHAAAQAGAGCGSPARSASGWSTWAMPDRSAHRRTRTSRSIVRRAGSERRLASGVQHGGLAGERPWRTRIGTPRRGAGGVGLRGVGLGRLGLSGVGIRGLGLGGVGLRGLGLVYARPALASSNAAWGSAAWGSATTAGVAPEEP